MKGPAEDSHSTWLLLLCAYLLVWVPLNVAALANRSLPSLADRGAAAAMELLAHAAAGMLCVAAGWMLWVRNVAGRRLARAALIVNAAVTIQALHASILPRDVSPGAEVPLTVVTGAHAVAWIVYLYRSRALSVWLEDVMDMADVARR